jgi:uncharacterized SAM-binding protein YcdF (DUF218 family)
MAHFALAVGALLILVLAIVGLRHLDPRIGQAALRESRQKYGWMIAVEAPVLVLVGTQTPVSIDDVRFILATLSLRASDGVVVVPGDRPRIF